MNSFHNLKDTFNPRDMLRDAIHNFHPTYGKYTEQVYLRIWGRLIVTICNTFFVLSAIIQPISRLLLLSHQFRLTSISQSEITALKTTKISRQPPIVLSLNFVTFTSLIHLDSLVSSHRFLVFVVCPPPYLPTM